MQLVHSVELYYYVVWYFATLCNIWSLCMQCLLLLGWSLLPLLDGRGSGWWGVIFSIWLDNLRGVYVYLREGKVEYFITK
jgi:hypothetical protein